MDVGGTVALIVGILAVVGVIVGGIAAAMTAVDRRRADASTVWRNVAEAREAEAHDCSERCARLEARVDMLEDEWRDRLTRDVAATTASAVVDVVLAAIREERHDRHT